MWRNGVREVFEGRLGKAGKQLSARLTLLTSQFV